MKFLVYFVPMIASLSVHECAHAWAALLLGDETAREHGRLTLNPLAHVDPFGTILLPALGIFATGSALFGWAKPTPVNPARFRREISVRAGMAITAAAGPASNVVLGALAGVAFGLSRRLWPDGALLAELLFATMAVNAGLAVFNLLPVPPLDGARVLAGLLPPRAALRYARFTALAPIVLLAFVAVPQVSSLLFQPTEGLLAVFRALARTAGGF